MFPNTVLKQSTAYTDMTISIHSALDALHPIKDIELGNDEYTTTAKILTDTRYTITFTGEGYRTYSVDVVIPKGAKKPAVTVWNNAMDTPDTVIVGSTEEKDKFDVTFLAGDIVKDEKINLYDLSSVAAYFGKENNTTKPAEGEWADKDYIKYDLNRDGHVDSKDIAMVLVSWNK